MIQAWSWLPVLFLLFLVVLWNILNCPVITCSCIVVGKPLYFLSIHACANSSSCTSPSGITQYALTWVGYHYQSWLLFESRSNRLSWLKITMCMICDLFLGWARGFDSVFCNLWPLMTSENSGVWMSSRLGFCENQRRHIQLQGQTAPQPEAKQTGMIREPTWPVGIPRHLLALWA